MGHYRFHRAYTPKTRAERITDMVQFTPQTINMPKFSSTDATIHAAQDLIHELQNPAPDIPLVTLVNVHKEALISR